MTVQKFNSLQKEQKKAIVLRQGLYLTERSSGHFDIMLYQLRDIYVEVYIFETYRKVALIRAFDSVNDLEPYLEEIDLSGMLQEAFS